MAVALVVLAGCASPYGADQAAVAPAATPPAPPGCDANGSYRFCDDFDHRDTLDDGRWKVGLSGAGALSLDEAESTSRGGTALASLEPAKASAGAYLSKELVLTGSKVRTELDMRVDTDLAHIQSGTTLFEVALDTGENAEIGIAGGQVLLQIVTTNDVVRIIPLDPFPVGAWTHVVLEIGFDAKDGHAFISADEKVLVDERKLTTLRATSMPSSFAIAPGVNGSAEVPVELRIDNVKVY